VWGTGSVLKKDEPAKKYINGHERNMEIHFFQAMPNIGAKLLSLRARASEVTATRQQATPWKGGGV
jgi:hypothetical protein